MPGLDQTGPQGQGQRTGKGLGPCGRGMGLKCFGFGRFAGRNYLSRSEEMENMEEEAKALESDLKALKERIAQIKG